MYKQTDKTDLIEDAWRVYNIITSSFHIFIPLLHFHIFSILKLLLLVCT